MKDSRGALKLRLIARINHLEFTHKLIHLCVEYLSHAYDPEIVIILQKHVRIPGRLNPENSQLYFQDLQTVLNHAQTLVAEIETKKAELNIQQSGEKPGEEISEDNFDALCRSVSLFCKFPLDKRSTAVSELVGYYRDMVETHEMMDAELQKAKK